jgi:hypothetical protein
VFAGGRDVCVQCGSTQWVWLQKYLKSLKEANEYVDKGDKNEHNKNPIRDLAPTGRVL